MNYIQISSPFSKDAATQAYRYSFIIFLANLQKGYIPFLRQFRLLRLWFESSPFFPYITNFSKDSQQNDNLVTKSLTSSILESSIIYPIYIYNMTLKVKFEASTFSLRQTIPKNDYFVEQTYQSYLSSYMLSLLPTLTCIPTFHNPLPIVLLGLGLN